MTDILIRNARLVNEGKISETDLLVRGDRIARIAPRIDQNAALEIDAAGKYLLPGIIDDQVHFREPGLTHKANIYTESRAAVAGGVTSYMEMPNVVPTSTTQVRLEEKYQIAARTSLANYSFYMGATNDNLEEVLRTDPERVCGVKIFMGSSTGDMLVDNPGTLEQIFASSPMLIATHCEDEATVRQRLAMFRERTGDEHLRAADHPRIRNEEACYRSSSMAIQLARKHGTRLHVLHISTAEEIDLFENVLPLAQKRITAEVCVHHLHFDASDYDQYGNQIKCNPAIKDAHHKAALFQALMDDRLDVIATDHAPHTWEEKSQPYVQAPSGVPLIQHTLQVMLGFYHRGMISLPKIVEKMCHAPAVAFRVRDRGFVREGYFADLVLFDPDTQWTVTPDNTYYKCGWSPFMGQSLYGKVSSTIVSGHLAWHEGGFDEGRVGQRLGFG
jgi:dihydroorotase